MAAVLFNEMRPGGSSVSFMMSDSLRRMCMILAATGVYVMTWALLIKRNKLREGEETK